MSNARRRPLEAMAAFVLFFGVAWRLMASGMAEGILANGLADIIFYAALVFYLAGMIRRNGPDLKADLAFGAFALFVIMFFLSSRISGYSRPAAGILMDLAALAAVLLVARGAVFKNGGTAQAAAFLAAAAAIPVAAGFFQYFYELPALLEGLRRSGRPGWYGGVYIDAKSLPDFITRVESREVFATFFNSNVFSGFIALALPVTIGLGAAILWGTGPKRPKIAGAAACGALAAALAVLLVLTKSKAGMAAAAFSVALLGIFVLYRLARRRVFAAVVAAALILAAGGVYFGLSRARQFYYEARTSFRLRVGYWHATGRMIKADPLEGVGPGNFAAAYLQYKAVDEETVQNPHNAYLLVWAEGGFFSLLFIAAFWALVFVPGGGGDEGPPAGRWAAAGAIAAATLAYAAFLYARGQLAEGGDRALAAALAAGGAAGAWLAAALWKATHGARAWLVKAGVAAGVVGFIAESAVDVSWSDAGAAAAAVFAAAILGRTKSAVLKAGTPGATAAAAGAALALILFVADVYVPYSQAEAEMTDAMAYVAEGDASAARASLREAMRFDPGNAEPVARLGRLYEAAARAQGEKPQLFTVAEGLYREALRLDERHLGAREGLARLYSAAGGNFTEPALEQYGILLHFYPTSSRYQLEAARFLERSGAREQALAHYRRALEIDGHVAEHGMQLSKDERLEIEAAIERLGGKSAASASGAGK